jgi:hypothetical protein
MAGMARFPAPQPAAATGRRTAHKMAKIYDAVIIAGAVILVNEYFNIETFTCLTASRNFIAFDHY